MRFLEAIKSIGGGRILRLIGVDEKGLFAVLDFNVGFGDTWLEIKDRITGRIFRPSASS